MKSKTENLKSNILIAPLNWGIGHATRCVPVIKCLIDQGFNPIIASDGDALELLKEQFPLLTYYSLPSYKISYPKNGFFMHLYLFFQSRKMRRAMKLEKKMVDEIVEKENLIGIISDNRFGVYSSKIPSVYITHQLTVKSGFTTFVSTKLHHKILKKFNEVWIPDNDNQTLSGDLSATNSSVKKKFIGVLSRLKKENLPLENDILVLLSGPEPQRTILEKKLRMKFENCTKKILFVRGLVNSNNQLMSFNNCRMVNYLNQSDLQKEMNQSELIIARSGYSTIMDLAVLNKKAFFIPTPGQSEQIYLAKQLKKGKIAPFEYQHKFSLVDLDKVKNYTGFTTMQEPLQIEFDIFKQDQA